MHAQQLVDPNQHKLELLARMGLLARAITYATIGLLAIQVAFSQGGKLTDSQGALQTLAAQPFGKLLLLVLAVGFVGYALWRTVEALKGTVDTHGNKGKIERAGYAVSAIVHYSLAFAAAKLALFSSASGGDATKTLSARVMEQPLGLWAVAAAGVILALFGIKELIKAFKGKFQERMDLHTLSAKAREAFCKVAKWGISARGLVFMIMGWFLVQAALSHNPNQARGLGGALQTIASQPFGKILLAVVAAGLVLYAVYSAFKAKYYQVPAHT